jgi:hypothetical protein
LLVLLLLLLLWMLLRNRMFPRVTILEHDIGVKMRLFD